ncbi:MAG: DUF1080 domain-containing protein [Bacteroidales bacterium]|nr:DUF1080 domain-containing protein [Bacteroidales bacterium]
MKKSIFYLMAIAFLATACTNKEKNELFSGENLDGWSIFVPDDITAESVFWVENNVIHTSGIPNAYLQTNEEYSSYKLHVEWRWLEEPKNSGVLIHKTGEDMIWPNCYEAQLMAGNAGDIVLIGKGVGLTISDTARVIESEENRYAIYPKIKDSSENAPGEWNSYDIAVNESSFELTVNDVFQNKGTNLTKSKGRICLQSEGGPMEFRNIYLMPAE